MCNSPSRTYTKYSNASDTGWYELQHMLPANIYAIRHGKSVGNLALAQAKKGTPTILENTEFQALPGSNWRLTEEGVRQAQVTGGFLRGSSFASRTLFFVSPFVRARETAAHLGIPGAQWRTDVNLRERDWGILEREDPIAREDRYKSELRDRHTNPFYWRPPQGESLADVHVRIQRFLETLHRDAGPDGDCDAVIVCHGEVMWTLRYCLERLTDEAFLELDRSTEVIDRIHNGHVYHYTRLNTDTGASTYAKSIRFARSIVPSLPGLDTWTDWREIKPKMRSNEELLASIAQYPTFGTQES